MSLKIENSRRVAKSRSVCMDLKTGLRRRRIALFQQRRNADYHVLHTTLAFQAVSALLF